MILYSEIAREKLQQGVKTINDAVSVTLGPKGRNVAIQKANGVHVTKDGITVANAVFSNDPTEQMAIQMIRQAAAKTASEAGDGTTTATILASAIVNEGIKFITAGYSPIVIKRSLEFAAEEATNMIQMLKKDLTTDEEVRHIASISANNDNEIGTLIADAIKQVGNSGIVTVEESGTAETFVQVVEGTEIDSGYISPRFADNKGSLVCELDNPLIFIYGKKITSFEDIKFALSHATNKGRSLLVICENIDGQALTSMIVNNIRGSLKSCAIKAPKYGIARKEWLRTIATLTGGVFINEEEGHSLAKVTENFFGSAKRVIVTPYTTTIIEGQGDVDTISREAGVLKRQLSLETSPYEKKKIKERLSKLLGKAAVLKVGAVTDVEMREKKDRIDDALHATRAALAEGIVAGAGHTSRSIGITFSKNSKESIGHSILSAALKEPFKRILENSDHYDIDTLAREEKGMVYNSLTDEWVDPFTAGIIDPAKVLRLAIANAVSVASMILTTECVIYNETPSELQ